MCRVSSLSDTGIQLVSVLANLLVIGLGAVLFYLAWSNMEVYKKMNKFALDYLHVEPWGMALGMTAIAIGILGLIAYLTWSWKLFAVHAAMVLGLAIVMITWGATRLALYQQYEHLSRVKSNLKALFQLENSEGSEEKNFERLQLNLQCCGVKSFEDYKKVQWQDAKIPPTCCRDYDITEGSGKCTADDSDASKRWKEGCLWKALVFAALSVKEICVYVLAFAFVLLHNAFISGTLSHYIYYRYL